MRKGTSFAMAVNSGDAHATDSPPENTRIHGSDVAVTYYLFFTLLRCNGIVFWINMNVGAEAEETIKVR